MPRAVRARMRLIISEGESDRLVERFVRGHSVDLVVLPLTVATRHFLGHGVLSGGEPSPVLVKCDFFLCPTAG